MSDIPNGFQIHITSSENDGDCILTKIISGLTKEELELVIKFCNWFRKNGNDYINIDENMEILYEEFLNSTLKEKFPNPYGKVDNYSYVNIIASQLMNSSFQNDNYGFIRKVEYFKIYFVEKPIINVTSQYK